MTTTLAAHLKASLAGILLLDETGRSSTRPVPLGCTFAGMYMVRHPSIKGYWFIDVTLCKIFLDSHSVVFTVVDSDGFPVFDHARELPHDSLLNNIGIVVSDMATTTVNSIIEHQQLTGIPTC